MAFDTPKFILTANGSLTDPVLHVGIYTDKVERAKPDAAKIAAKLSLAGYFNFWLTDSDDNIIGRFKVDRPEPEAVFIEKK